MLSVVCVEWGDYLGRSAEYKAKLMRGVERHLAQPYAFEILCEPEPHPRLPAAARGTRGTWEKLALFQPGRFPGPVLYLDLDSVVVGPLDPIAEHMNSAVHLADWGWERNVHAGGCLVFDQAQAARIWEAFDPRVPGLYENDQEWMTTLGVWGRLPPELVRSYRYHAKAGPPAGCSVVAFHGSPKPHELGGWVQEAWR